MEGMMRKGRETEENIGTIEKKGKSHRIMEHRS